MNETLEELRHELMRVIAMSGFVLTYNADDILVLWDGDTEVKFHEFIEECEGIKMNNDDFDAVVYSMCEDYYELHGDGAEKAVFDAIMRGYVMTGEAITNKESELLTQYISKTIQGFRDEHEK